MLLSGPILLVGVALTGDRVERRLAAVLAADVVGYSRLMGVDEEGTLARLKALRRDLLDPSITSHRGRIVKTTGDGLLVEFASVVEAMRCAVEVQRGMVAKNSDTPAAHRIEFRIGIHVGDIILDDSDIFGDGVNIAARLEGIARPGGIAISQRGYEDVRDRLPIELEEGGAQQLKNIGRPVQVWHWAGTISEKGTSRGTADNFDWTNQKVSYCRAPDGVRIAYASIGEGQLALVKAGGFLSHLQYDHTIWGPSYLQLANGRQFLRYDARGNGLSDWEVKDLSPEAWVIDLETVVDAAKLQRFALIGYSQGCATAIAYAVKHPQRVSHLILYAGYARGAFVGEDKQREQNARAFVTLMRNGWQSENPAFRQIFATRMLPDMNAEQAKNFDKLLKETCTGELAERYQLTVGDIDIRHLLPQVTTPTLVIHVRDDAMVPQAGSRELSDGIAGARFVSIPGRNHVPIPGDPTADRAFEEIDRFLAENISPSELATPAEDSRPSTALSLPAMPSIAVLPFQNMSSDPEQEYFADGIVEDIITALSRFKSLFVIARNSSFAYKGKAVDIKQVGRELGVRYVLEGSVRKLGDRLRIAGQVIEADTGNHIWADKFDGKLDDIFDVQEDIVSCVVGSIAPRLVQAELDTLKRRSSENWRSYEHFLRGVSLRYERRLEATNEAIHEFKSAIALEPNFGQAYARAAHCTYVRKSIEHQAVDAAEVSDALRLAEKALELSYDDEITLGLVAFVFSNLDTQYRRAALLAERSVTINPNYSLGWNAKGWTDIQLGEHQRALQAFSRAIRLNPLDAWAMPNLLLGSAAACFFIERYDEGINHANRVLAQLPKDLLGLVLLFANASWLGRDEIAASAGTRLRDAFPSLRSSHLRDLYDRVERPEDRVKVEQLVQKIGLPD